MIVFDDLKDFAKFCRRQSDNARDIRRQYAKKSPLGTFHDGQANVWQELAACIENGVFVFKQGVDDATSGNAQQRGGDAAGSAGQGGDGRGGPARSDAGPAAAAPAGPMVAAEVGGSGEPIEREDSPDGKHSFTPDLEYDPSGESINCEFCGLLPEQARESKMDYLHRLIRKASQL